MLSLKTIHSLSFINIIYCYCRRSRHRCCLLFCYYMSREGRTPLSVSITVNIDTVFTTFPP